MGMTELEGDNAENAVDDRSSGVEVDRCELIPRHIMNAICHINTLQSYKRTTRG